MANRLIDPLPRPYVVDRAEDVRLPHAVGICGSDGIGEMSPCWNDYLLPSSRGASTPEQANPHKPRRSLPGQLPGRDPQILRNTGVWVAGVVERCLKWPLTHSEEMQEAVMPREESLGRVAQLIPETPTGGDCQGSPAVPESERALK